MKGKDTNDYKTYLPTFAIKLHSLFVCFPGYRHVRLRSATNQPLELSTVFIYSRLEEEVPIDMFSMTTDSLREEKRDTRKQLKALLAKVKDVGDLGKPEKEVGGLCFVETVKSEPF